MITVAQHQNANRLLGGLARTISPRTSGSERPRLISTAGPTPGFYVKGADERQWSVGADASQVVAPKNLQDRETLKTWLDAKQETEQRRRIHYNWGQERYRDIRRHGIEQGILELKRQGRGDTADLAWRLQQLKAQRQMQAADPLISTQIRLYEQVLNRKWQEQVTSRLPEFGQGLAAVDRYFSRASYPLGQLVNLPIIATLSPNQQRFDMAFLEPSHYRTLMKMAQSVMP